MDEIKKDRLIIGRKPCGNPECNNQIEFTNQVAFQSALKYRPKSLCKICKARKAAQNRKPKNLTQE